jgi:uncharacterized YigZ family protein
MRDAYRSIARESTGEFKDRGSKFLGYIFPITEEAQFHNRQAELRAQHLKARHHCWGFRLRSGLERSSDDGEPSGSAGKPIFNQLLSAELVDVGCIVVRYYGGTKLGVSGLINAYKQGALLSIEAAEIVTLYNTLKIEISFDYVHMGRLMDILKQTEGKIVDQVLDLHPKLHLQVNESEAGTTIDFIKSRILGRGIEDITEDTIIEGLSFAVLENK